MKRYLKMIACFTLLYAASCNANDSNIIIFASFSMPKESIKQWIRQGTEIQAPIVIRGLVNNSFKDTINVLYNLNQEMHGGVQLDPTLFQKYQINKVPAVVVTNTANCLPNQSCHETYDVVYGDVTLSYALKMIAAKNDDVSSIANTALTILKENHDL